MLNGKRILITGGTGSFGRRFTDTVLHLYPQTRGIVIFSRDAAKQQEMAGQLSEPRMQFISGDMANSRDVDKACGMDIDIIIHTAAMRIVPEAEAHPYACVCTNITGAQNLIDSAIKHHITQIIALSTDMASLVHNVYGATKMLSDRLFIAAHRDYPDLRTTVIRYGNMLASTGTVIPFFMRKAQEEGILPVTDTRMTRFMASVEDCVEIALKALNESLGGEIIAPKFKSYNIMTIAEAVAPQCPTKTVGLRPGENLFETMVTRQESYHTLETADKFIILPPYAAPETYSKHYRAHPVSPGIEFNSENNPDKFTTEEIRKLIRDIKI